MEVIRFKVSFYINEGEPRYEVYSVVATSFAGDACNFVKDGFLSEKEAREWALKQGWEEDDEHS